MNSFIFHCILNFLRSIISYQDNLLYLFFFTRETIKKKTMCNFNSVRFFYDHSSSLCTSLTFFFLLIFSCRWSHLIKKIYDCWSLDFILYFFEIDTIYFFFFYVIFSNCVFDLSNSVSANDRHAHDIDSSDGNQCPMYNYRLRTICVRRVACH